MPKPEKYGHLGLPDSEYFDLHAVSNSKMVDLCKSPHHYWASWRTTWEESDAMRFGKVFHCYLLEPDEFEKRYFLFDESERPDKKRTMSAQVNSEWKVQTLETERNQGRLPYTIEDKDKMEGMKEAIYREVSAWALLDAPGSFEHSYVWKQEVEYFSRRKFRQQVAEVNMKLKADKWLKDEGMILDLKTTRDAGPKWWDRHAWEYGYHRQAALYSDQLGAEEYYVLAVETSYPYGVALYRADPGLLEKGRNYQAGTSDPGWGYRPLLEKICQLREVFGSEFYFGEDAKPWPTYSYWAPPKADGVLNWRPPLWA